MIKKQVSYDLLCVKTDYLIGESHLRSVAHLTRHNKDVNTNQRRSQLVVISLALDHLIEV